DGVTLRFGGRSSISENEGFAKWTTVEDVPTEGAITDKAASTWYTYKGTMFDSNYSRMGGSDELSFIKFHSASPTNADLYWDNIRLFYKPKTTTVKFAEVEGVTFENKVLENVFTTGVKVSELLDMAGFEYDDFLYALKGVTVGNGTEVYGSGDTVSFGGKTTVHVVLEEKDLTGWLDEEKGLLLYEVTFDGIENGTKIEQGAKLHTFGRVNPYIEGSEDWYLNLSGFGTVANNDYGVVVDGALKTLKTASGRWSQIQFSGETINGNNGCTMIADGTIYKEADMKLVTSVSGVTLGLTGYARKYNETTGKWEGTTNNQNSVQTIAAADFEAGEWHSLSGSKVLEGQEYNSESCTIFLPTYPAEGGTGDEYYLDNLRLYWKPAKANLTVYGGSNADYETVTLKNVSTSASIDEVIALLPGSEYGKITGLADMDGNKLTDLGLVSSKSVVAIWTPWVVVDGGQEFAVEAKGVSGGGSGQWSGSYGNTNDVGNGGGQVTAAISWMYGNGWYTKDGNLYRVQDTVAIGEKNTGATNDPAIWATPAVRTATDTIRDNITTTLVADNDAEYVLVKYRYTNVPNLAEVVANDPNPEGYKYTLSANGEELTYYDRTGAAQVFDMSPAYGAKYYINGGNFYAGGEEFRKNELFVEGEWLYDFLPFVAGMNTSGVNNVIIQRYNLFDQMVTEYDYVHFVKLGEEEDVVLPEIPVEPGAVEAPKSLEENTAMRLEEGKENGIRFQASVTSDTNNKATTIGWVIVSYDNFMAGGTQSYDNLTVETEKSKIGYQRLDGTNLANFFDTSDDEALVMAAVLKGIPEDNYASYILMRPFVKVEDTYYYGEATSTCLYDIAAALYYDNTEVYDALLTPEQQVYVEDVVLYCEDNGLV
ncbi:MAG: hypothetical protein J6E38_05270, partial [Clostridia bacterium]|nr:hypothetical protein [Clostridia bacterium]